MSVWLPRIPLAVRGVSCHKALKGVCEVLAVSVWSVLSALAVFVAGLSAGRAAFAVEAGRLFVPVAEDLRRH